MKPLLIKILIVIFYCVAIPILFATSCQNNCIETMLGMLVGFMSGIGLSVVFFNLSGGEK